MPIKALDNAIKAQKPISQAILHSDLGSQYTSSKFKDYVENNNIIHSFSRNPYDNACIESSHASLKKEEVNLVTYYDFDVARLAIFEYIGSSHSNATGYSLINRHK